MKGFDPSEHTQAGIWSTVWRTDDLDSDGALISGLAHVPGLPNLPGGDGARGLPHLRSQPDAKPVRVQRQRRAVARRPSRCLISLPPYATSSFL